MADAKGLVQKSREQARTAVKGIWGRYKIISIVVAILLVGVLGYVIYSMFFTGSGINLRKEFATISLGQIDEVLTTPIDDEVFLEYSWDEVVSDCQNKRYFLASSALPNEADPAIKQTIINLEELRKEQILVGVTNLNREKEIQEINQQITGLLKSAKLPAPQIESLKDKLEMGACEIADQDMLRVKPNTGGDNPKKTRRMVIKFTAQLMYDTEAGKDFSDNLKDAKLIWLDTIRSALNSVPPEMILYTCWRNVLEQCILQKIRQRMTRDDRKWLVDFNISNYVIYISHMVTS